MKEKIIQEELNQIIKSFYNKSGKAKSQIKKAVRFEPVNWGHLSCVEVKQCYVAYIREASPVCTELRKYLKEKLKEKGYSDEIEIITEW
jgi:hypothetical protein